ncbi:MAG: hypothetical protein A2096_12650 [Spirochaetes bacterium GWF1_41_5]|nr:MAG: hypothetical protein A2096_12650 [Spirochaetes bacterium GWF1_41_5]
MIFGKYAIHIVKRMKRRIVIIVLPIFSGISFLIAIVIYKNHECLSKIENLLIGFAASCITVIIYDLVNIFHVHCEYAYLQGEYIRTEIKNGATKLLKENIRDDYTSLQEYYINNKISDKIKVIHLNNRKYQFIIQYEEGTAHAFITLNENEKHIGDGYYYYTKNIPDHGTMSIVVTEEDNIKIYAYHKNRIPSGTEFGYEIWEKQKNRLKKN